MLYTFQKKSKRGIATPKADLDLIGRRLKRKRGLRGMVKKRRREIAVTASSGNVFADLGFAEPEDELTKTELASHIRQMSSGGA